MSAMKNLHMDNSAAYWRTEALTAQRDAADFMSQLQRAEKISVAALTTLIRWSHDGALQTLEDRERFRAAARAIIAEAEGTQP